MTEKIPRTRSERLLNKEERNSWSLKQKIGAATGAIAVTASLLGAAALYQRAEQEKEAREWDKIRKDPTYILTNDFNNGSDKDAIEYDLPAGNVGENAVKKMKATVTNLEVNPNYQDIADALAGQNGLDSANKGEKVKSRVEDVNNDGAPEYIDKHYWFPSNYTKLYLINSTYKFTDTRIVTIDTPFDQQIGQQSLMLVQLWFKKFGNKNYTFRLFLVGGYNYLLNVSLVEDTNVTQIQSYIAVPQNKFIVSSHVQTQDN